MLSFGREFVIRQRSQQAAAAERGVKPVQGAAQPAGNLRLRLAKVSRGIPLRAVFVNAEGHQVTVQRGERADAHLHIADKNHRIFQRAVRTRAMS